MSTPTTGYDMSAQLSKVATSAKSAATKAAAELKKQAMGAVGKEVDKQINNASDVLKSKLGSNLDRVNKIADAAERVKGLASKFSQGGDSADVGEAATSSMRLINAKLADTMFVALPTEEVLVADAYGLKGNATLNTVVGKLTGFANDLLSKAGGLKGLGKGLATSALATITSGGKIDAKALTGRVLDSLGGKSGILNSLSDQVRTGLGESIGLPPGIYDKIESVVSGQLLGYSNIDVSSARGIFDIVGRVTGDPEIAEFFDVGAEAQLLSTMYREAISMGLPGAVDAMHQKAKSSEAAYYALQSNLIVASQRAELDTLNLMAEVLGPERILGDNPRVVAQILANYTLPDGVAGGSYSDSLESLDNTLKKIDPNWGKYLRGDTWVADLSAFNNLSDDARTVLSSDPVYSETLALAGTYPTRDLIELGRTSYPGLVL